MADGEQASCPKSHIHERSVGLDRRAGSALVRQDRVCRKCWYTASKFAGRSSRCEVLSRPEIARRPRGQYRRDVTPRRICASADDRHRRGKRSSWDGGPFRRSSARCRCRRSDRGAYGTPAMPCRGCEEKLVFANSPSLLPRPVKSKRNTAIPCSAIAPLIRAAAKMSFEQVKQCANSAKPTRSWRSIIERIGAVNQMQ